ncbi:Salicylate hydroxylase [Termitomyces sp. T112]|nr:Salicylate hydroxylase [Termitomyces sp. T112]
MKVIIIGAGIGGLSAYHSLKKNLANDKVTIKVYESHGPPGTTKVGGGLGLAPNGLRAIASISLKTIEYIQTNAYPGPIFTFRNSSGRLLGHFWSGRKERYGFDQMMVRRAVLHEALLLDIPADVVTWNSELQSVRETDEGVEVEFANGSSDTADLVIGADGVWSIVRECIFEKQYSPVYDGFSGVGGFIPLSRLSPRIRESLKSESVTMTFGSPGFFGYSLTSPSKPAENSDLSTNYIQWWSIYESPTPPTRSEADPSTVRAHLLSQHASWKSPYDTPGAPVFEEIINLGCTTENEFLVLPRYEAPRMPSWSTPSGSGRIILLGDAAHVMPPDSGQGASCAIEDAVAIGVLLHRYFEIDDVDIKDALKNVVGAYEGVRMKRVWKILDMAKRSGNSKKRQSWLQQKIRDLFLGIFCKLPESVNDGLYMYDVEAAVDQYVKR